MKEIEPAAGMQPLPYAALVQADYDDEEMEGDARLFEISDVAITGSVFDPDWSVF